MFQSNENSEIWDSYVLGESPLGIPTFPTSYNDSMDNIGYDTIVSSTKSVKILDGIDIRERIDIDNIVELYCIYNGEFAAYYKFRILKNSIETMGTWNSLSHKGFFLKIFIHYIIPTYHTIESDNAMTNLGFSFWKKILTQNSRLFLYVKKNNILSPIYDIRDIDKYKETPRDSIISTFIISEYKLI